MISDCLASRQFTEWLAVAEWAHRHVIHAKTSSAVLPHEVERYKRIQRNALIEAGKLLAVKSSERGREAMMQAAE